MQVRDRFIRNIGMKELGLSDGPGVQGARITYEAALKFFWDRPGQIEAVASQLKVPAKKALRLWNIGIPPIGLPPIREVFHLEMVEAQELFEKRRAENQSKVEEMVLQSALAHVQLTNLSRQALGQLYVALMGRNDTARGIQEDGLISLVPKLRDRILQDLRLEMGRARDPDPDRWFGYISKIDRMVHSLTDGVGKLVAIERQVLGAPDKQVSVRFDPVPERTLGDGETPVDVRQAREEAEAVLRAIEYADQEILDAGELPQDAAGPIV